MATAFFILSKIVGVLLLVESWLMLGVGSALLALWVGRVRLARNGLLVTALLLLTVISPLTDIGMYQLEKVYPEKPDISDGEGIYGIILLGGSTILRQTDYWQELALNEAGERVTETMRLSRLLPDAKILLSGGSGSVINGLIKDKVRSEAEITSELLVDMGMDAGRLLLEDKSRNTAENAQLSAKLVGNAKEHHWLLVTSAYHMPRAMRSFRRAGWTNISAYPVDHRTDPSHFVLDWYPKGKFERADHLIKEIVGLVVYTITNR